MTLIIVAAAVVAVLVCSCVVFLRARGRSKRG